MLDPQVSPEEIKSREVELGLRVGILSLQLFPMNRKEVVSLSGSHCFVFALMYDTMYALISTILIAIR